MGLGDRKVNRGKVARARGKRQGERGGREGGPSAVPWKKYVAQCRAVLERCDELPEEAEDFQASVDEKIRGMMDWAEEHQHVTAKMVSALENMDSGIERWLEREDY